MGKPRFLYKFFIINLFGLIYLNADAQFATKICDYLPAPGQYTNSDFFGTPTAANSIVGTNKGLVSLGAYGGSITVYFADGIKNDPANPYGVDFTIYGNPTLTWSEPGIIQVMKDENKNGLPDDTWYEIAGSDHYWNSTISNYEVTYLNSGQSQASDIQWTDNQGKSGFIPVNSFHQQPYYPESSLFPNVASDQYTLKGTRISGQIDLSNPGVVNCYRRAFGYADNTPVISATEKMPDNPYTSEIEGSGGDAIDISWAVDRNMKPVYLDEIHFIRIYTGMNALAGWLGEISTDITGIRDVEPASVEGVRSMVAIQDLPPKIGLGKTFSLNAIAFESGIPQVNTSISWSVSNPDLASVENGQLTAKKNGTVRLRATSSINPNIFAEKELEIFSAEKAVITIPSTSIKVNDKIELTGKFTDQAGNVISGIAPSWSVENELIAEIVLADGKSYLKGKQAGKSWLYLETAEMNSLRDSVLVEVFPESAQKKVFISVKTSEKTILPRQSVWVEQFDLTSKVDRTQKSYGLQEINFVSLAHAVASVFKNTALYSEMAFRDDAEGGSALYLWKVPETDDGSTAYNFGYGGSRTSEAYRKTWVILLNQQSFVSGFDKIKVNNDDEILIYQIMDNSLPWSVTHLISGADSVKLNQKTDIQLKNYTCSMDANRNVTVTSSEAFANQTIRVAAENQTSISLTTDEFGIASFTPQKSGNYLIISGIDASKLFVEPITGSLHSLKNQLICKVQPNPFTESIRVDCPSSISSLEILNVEGILVYKKTNSAQTIDLSSLSAGVYILRVWAGSQVFQQKIIKN